MKISKEKLKQIICEELSKMLSESDNSDELTNKYNHLLPYAERLCNLLPVPSIAHLLFICHSGENTYFTYEEALDDELEHGNDENPDDEINSVLVITLGDAASSDYNDELLHSFGEDISLIDGTDESIEWFKAQCQKSSYSEIDEKIKTIIDEKLENCEIELKSNQTVDVDLD